MYWKITIDYGMYQNYHRIYSSEFAANLIANNWRELAKARGDNKTKIYVEVVR